MRTCPICSAEIAEGSRFCGACGADLSASAPTMTRAASVSATTSSSLDEARFPPGAQLTERYRIVGLLGRGGMGEVYRAEDRKLGQTVALKFLPADMEGDDSRLTRLLSEVRLAREVSHPNVCRVYDIDEADGSHFMTMEYVDGEDLSSLLRRIGRLPQEKALEIARQICAGLAAAHARGILHRDLKPANIMVDGRGQAKLADFGLAGLGAGLSGAEARAGTPAYMAPEQLAGGQVTEASDIYALGLVLYEIFTGEAVLRGKSLQEITEFQAESALTHPSTLVSDFDAAVERVILRCLEPRPEDRPASALDVAAALPGGDPIAAALAAGETPSPQMVAEAGPTGGIRPLLAWSMLAAFLALLAVNIVGHQRYQTVAQADLPKSPGVLQEKAREILASLGHDSPPRDSVYDFSYNTDYMRHLRDEKTVAERRPLLEARQPAPILFGYRQSPGWLEYENKGEIGGWVERSIERTPGELRMRLDAVGRLVGLEVATPDSVGAVGVVAEPDWDALLVAAGFEPARFAEAEPEWMPDCGYDLRGAWTGVYPDAPDVPIRVEAAALRGKPVSFRIVEPWTRPRAVNPPGLWGRAAIGSWTALVGSILRIAALGTIALLAWRNLRTGRGDRRTALRFAVALAAARFTWYLFGHHVPTREETDILTAHLAWSLYRFGYAYAFYAGLEPYLRKMWPHMFTSWVRLFDNRFRDPLVGRDVLAGLVLAGISMLNGWVWLLSKELLGQGGFGMSFDQFSIEALRGVSGALLAFVGNAARSVDTIFFMVTIIFLVRLIVRRNWITMFLFALLMMGFNLGRGLPDLSIALAFFILIWIALFRFGLLTFAVFLIAGAVLGEMPMTFELGAWHAAPTWITLIAMLAIALWAFRISLAGRPAGRGGMLRA